VFRTSSTRGLKLDLDKLHYFVGHVDLLEGGRRHGMVAWRDRLFILMASSQDATATYQIPQVQVMKVGLQVGI
jgi:KUP system potassium uptake protein